MISGRDEEGCIQNDSHGDQSVSLTNSAAPVPKLKIHQSQHNDDDQRDESNYVEMNSMGNGAAADDTNDTMVVAKATGAILSTPRKESRAIFLDWARSVAVYAVVIVHIFVSVQRVTRSTPDLSDKIEGSFRSILQYGMPMFFYFSGRSAAYSKDTFLKFLWTKTLRLIVPCIVGLLVVVIPTCYVGRSYRPCASPHINNFFEFYGNFFTEQIACDGLDWYWFLPVLYVLAVFNQPLLRWVKNRYPNSQIVYAGREDVFPLCYIILLACVLILVAIFIECPFYYVFLFLAPHFSIYFLMFVVGKSRRYNFIYLYYITCALPSLILALIIKDTYPSNTRFSSIAPYFLMVFFYNYFYFEGYVDTIFDEDWRQWRDTARLHAGLKPLGLLLLIVLLAATAPSTATSAGYLWTYPLYKREGWLCVSYVGGTWLWLMVWIRYAETFYNEVLNEFEYTHLTTSSMLVYLTHWFFIDLIQVLFVKPYDMQVIPGACILIPSVAICCAALYIFLIHLRKLIRYVCRRGSTTKEPAARRHAPE